MPSTEIPEELLERLRTVADHDYGGASLEETLDRLLPRASGVRHARSGRRTARTSNR